MPKIELSGFDEIQKSLQETEAGLEDFIDTVLADGGQIAKAKVEQSITRHHHFRTGELLRSIKITKSKDKDGQKYVEVKAAGKRSTGTANDYVAYVLNYGRSNFRGSRFWAEAEEQARKEYEELVNQKTDLFLKEKGLN